MGSDLCSVIGIKNEQKAVVTASDGYIHLYNWEEFGHPSDMFPGKIPPGFRKILRKNYVKNVVKNSIKILSKNFVKKVRKNIFISNV